MLAKHSLLNDKKTIKLDHLMFIELSQAVMKNKVVDKIPTRDHLYCDMLLIDAYPDELAQADKIKLDFYSKHGMKKQADELSNAISKITFNEMRRIAKFLTDQFNLQGKDSPLVLRDGTDPRFNNNFYAPTHHRVALSTNLIEHLNEFLSQTSYAQEIIEDELKQLVL